MLLFRRSDELPAALDAGSDTVKLLQLARCPGGLRVVAAARQSQSETGGPALPRLSAILRRMRIDAPFTTRRVIAAMPGEIVHFRTLRVAPADAREIDRARFEGHLREEAARQFPFDLDCASVRFLHAGPVRQGGMERQEAIAVAVKNADIAAFVDQLHEGGLRPVALWPGPLAAYWWGAGERQRPGLGARWWGRHSCLPSDSSADKNGCLTASASPSPSPGTP
ncbi:MAG TPA: hypothetical protein VFC78_15930, partial [Tepidisphaeraceae bacterium]|nr:hypothetical protein [Tepidisphaeraceae bacterium]